MKCLLCTCKTHFSFPDFSASKRIAFLFPSFLLLLVKKSKDVHSYKICRGPITDVLMVRLLKFKCWQLSLQPTTQRAQQLHQRWTTAGVRRLPISWATAHQRLIPTPGTLSKLKLSCNLQCLFCPTLWPRCFLHGFTQFVLYIHKNSHWLQKHKCNKNIKASN